ncbi:MAG: hypothetical protein ACUVT7_09665 [Thermoplasmata archaeon]
MKKSRMMLIVVVVIILMLLTISLFGNIRKNTEQTTPLDSPALPGRGYFMGLLATPATGQSFVDAYAEAALYADFVPVWGKPSPFYAMPSDLSGSWGDTFVKQYIRGNGMFPLVHFSFFGPGMTLIKPPGMDSATLSDPAWRSAYKSAILDAVRAVRPLYLSVGNEVNRWFEKYGAKEGDPNGFQHFVTLYEDVYDAVKELSNRTQVFCVFSREIVSEYREADLSVLTMFNSSKLDLLAFTSYAYAVQGVNRPADLPDDYYSRALAYMPGKRIGLTELGWPSLDAFGGEQGQADFLADVVGRLTLEQGVELHMLAWAWLHDLDANDDVGLIEDGGTEKLAYSVWKGLSAGW